MNCTSSGPVSRSVLSAGGGRIDCFSIKPLSELHAVPDSHFRSDIPHGFRADADAFERTDDAARLEQHAFSAHQRHAGRAQQVTARYCTACAKSGSLRADVEAHEPRSDGAQSAPDPTANRADTAVEA